MCIIFLFVIYVIQYLIVKFYYCWNALACLQSIHQLLEINNWQKSQTNIMTTQLTYNLTTSLKRNKSQFNNIMSTLKTATKQKISTRSLNSQAPIFRIDKNNKSLQHSKPLQNKQQFISLNSDSSMFDRQVESQFMRSIIDRISMNIEQDEKMINKKQQSNKHVRHFYYNGINRMVGFPKVAVPKIVRKVYEECLKNSQKYVSKNNDDFLDVDQQPSQPAFSSISFNQGILQNIGYVYYSIEQQLILIKISDLLKMSQRIIQEQGIPYCRGRLPKHVIKIVQMNKSAKYNEQNGIEKLFPDEQNLLILIFPWNLGFFGWKAPHEIMPMHRGRQDQEIQFPLIDLNTIYQLPVQNIQMLDYSSDHSLFYFDKKACLYHLLPAQETKFRIIKTSRYTLKTYITSKPNTFEYKAARKWRGFVLANIAHFCGETLKVLLPFKFQTRKIFCDRHRNLLFGLLCKQTQSLFSCQEQLFIVCYDIKQKNSRNQCIPSLLYSLSEDKLYEKIGSHIQKSSRRQFHIKSIEAIPSHESNANLLVVMYCGIRMYINITREGIRLIEVIRPLNLYMLDQKSSFNITADRQLYSPIFFKNTEDTYSYLSSAPESSQMYNTLGYISDDQNFIAIMARHHRSSEIKSTVVKRVRNRQSGQVDINHMVSEIDLDFGTQLSKEKKLDMYKLSESCLLSCMNFQDNKLRFQALLQLLRRQEIQNQFMKQVFLPPKMYLIHTQEFIHFVTQLRPIDIIFTIIASQISQSTRDQLQSALLLENIFLGNQKLPLFGTAQVNGKELLAMLFQIFIDKQGSYLYSEQIAKTVKKLKKAFEKKSSQKMQSGYKLNSNARNSSRQNSSLNSQKNSLCSVTGEQNPKIYRYIDIQRSILDLIPKLIDYFSRKNYITPQQSSKDQFFDFEQQSFDINFDAPKRNDKVAEQRRINLRLESILIYLSRVLSAVWNIQIHFLKQYSLHYFYSSKIKSIQRYLNQNQPLLTSVSSQEPPAQHESKQLFTNIKNTLKLTIQFFTLIIQLPILPRNLTFSQCLRNFFNFPSNQKFLDAPYNCFQMLMLKGIRKYCESKIVSKWKQMFPSFCNARLQRMTFLYQEIEDIYENAQKSKAGALILKYLKNSSVLVKHGLPLYFIVEYLVKIYHVDAYELRSFIKSPESFFPVYLEDGTLWTALQNHQPFEKQLKPLLSTITLKFFNSSMHNKKLPGSLQQILKKYRQKNKKNNTEHTLTTDSQLADLDMLINILTSHIQQNLYNYGEKNLNISIATKYFLISELTSLLPVVQEYQSALQKYQLSMISYQTSAMLDSRGIHNNPIVSQLLYVQKCIIMQHELNKYYESIVSKCSSSDGSTNQLLQYNLLTSEEHLQKLVLSTMDSTLTLYHYAIFSCQTTIPADYGRSRSNQYCQSRTIYPSHPSGSDNIHKFINCYRDYCLQYNQKYYNTEERLNGFLSEHIQSVIFHIANKSKYSIIILCAILNTTQKYLIHQNEPLQNQHKNHAMYVKGRDYFGIQQALTDLFNFRTSTKENGSKEFNLSFFKSKQEKQEKFEINPQIFRFIQLLISIGYQPHIIFKVQLYELETLYHLHSKNLWRNNFLQFQYWLKWISCFLLLQNYYTMNIWPKNSNIDEDRQLEKKHRVFERLEDQRTIKTEQKNPRPQSHKVKKQREGDIIDFITVTKDHMKGLENRQELKIGLDKILEQIQRKIV